MPKLIFEDFQDEAISIVAKRKGSWTLDTVPWEDVEQILLTRLWLKFKLYDQSLKFENWANRTISNALKNLLRDNCYKFQRPCLKCAYNVGGDGCSFTSNNQQCAQCPLYAGWAAKKQNLFNIKSAFSIENHIQTIGNMQCDFVDVDSAKKIIDKQVLANLDTAKERKLYRVFYVKKIEERETEDFLQKESITEEFIEEFKKKVVDLARLVIRRENLTGKEMK